MKLRASRQAGQGQHQPTCTVASLRACLLTDRHHLPTLRLRLCLQRARANDEELHTDKTMFSCGSLAPKLQRGGGSCMDHGFAR